MNQPTPLHQVRIAGTGTGPTLVLLHAFPLDHRVWLPAARLLAPQVRQILLFDLPGHGDSPIPQEVGLEVAADAVAHAIEAAETGPVALAGLSMGGYVALALAQRHPHLVAGLALVDSKASPDAAAAATKRHELAAALADHGITAVLGQLPGLLAPTSEPHPLLAQLTEWTKEQQSQGVAWSALSMAARPDRAEVIREANYPVVFIAGEHDGITALGPSSQEFTQLAHVSTAQIPGAGHLAALEAPEATAAELARFLTRLTPGSGHH